MGNMRGDWQKTASERDQSQEKDEAAGQPDAALPPYRRQDLANATHQQHGRKGPEAECRHGEKTGQGSCRARSLGCESVDQRTRQEAVEHTEGEGAAGSLHF